MNKIKVFFERAKRALLKMAARIAAILRSIYHLPGDLFLFAKESCRKYSNYVEMSRRAFETTDALEVVKISFILLITSILAGWQEMQRHQRVRSRLNFEDGEYRTSWIDYTLYFS